MGDFPNSGSDQAKTCAEALQAAQKRVRLAFFLTMGASCIVLLIVLNLWNSFLVHSELLKSDSLSQLEYWKEYTKQIADQSFYQIPWLGIQITCDDIGLLGPLTLLVFSLYSFMALRACSCHLKHASSITNNPLINALFELEKPETGPGLIKLVFSIPRWLQLLAPLLVCVAVFFYCRNAHFNYALQDNALDKFMGATRPLAQQLDRLGWSIMGFVLLSNCATFRIARDIAKPKEKAKKTSA